MLILIIAICLIVITWPFWAALIYGVFMGTALTFALSIKVLASLDTSLWIGAAVVLFVLWVWAAWVTK